MAPVLFPAFLLAQGKLPGRVVCPLLAGPGFPCFGVGFPLGLEGARWALVPRAGVSSCFWMARWRRLGLGRGRTAVSAVQGRAEGQVPPVALEKGIDPGRPWALPRRGSCRPGTARPPPAHTGRSKRDPQRLP